MKRFRIFSLAMNSFSVGTGIVSTGIFINLGHAGLAALAAALCMISAGYVIHFARELAD